MNERQKRFIVEYLIDRNGTQAAIRAGYSPKTANEQASRLLAKDNIRAAVDAKTHKVMSKLEITAERVLKERARLAFLDPRKLVDAKGKALGLHELDEDTAAAVAGFETIGRRVSKLKIADKNASLTALEKHLGLYKDDAGGGSPLHIHLHLE